MINRYTTITSFCPALAGIDKQVVKWLCEMVGYTNVAESGGILLSGGSLANFMGILCARHHNLKVPENYHKGIVYCSDQTHCSILRGCYLAGIQAKNIKKFPTSIQSNFEIDFKELEAQIEKDLKTNEGIPFLLICNVGTTNTGKIENLQESLRISKKFNLWLHGDGCYSTCYTLLQDCKENYFKGLGEFDSISTDPHKGLFSPYGLGAFLIKQWKLLYNTFSFKTEDIAYYPSSMENNDDLLNSKLLSDSFDLGIENSRDFKALKLWLPLRLLGVNTFKNYLKEKLQLADYLYKELIKEKDLEIISHNFTVIVFRYYEKNSEKTLQEWNNINKKFLININSSVTVAISQTFLREKDSEELLFVCRACVICVRTHKENVIELIESIRNSLEYIKNISKKNE